MAVVDVSQCGFAFVNLEENTVGPDNSFQFAHDFEVVRVEQKDKNTSAFVKIDLSRKAVRKGTRGIAVHSSSFKAVLSLNQNLIIFIDLYVRPINGALRRSSTVLPLLIKAAAQAIAAAMTGAGKLVFCRPPIRRTPQMCAARIHHKHTLGVPYNMSPDYTKSAIKHQTTSTFVAHPIVSAVSFGFVNCAFLPAKSVSTTPRAVAQAFQT